MPARTVATSLPLFERIAAMVIGAAFLETLCLHVRVETLTFNRQREAHARARPDPAARPAASGSSVRLMRWGALFSLAIAAIAVLLVARGDRAIHIHMLIATALGVGLSVLLGIALMTLVFLSNRAATTPMPPIIRQKDENDPSTIRIPSCASSPARATSMPTAISSAAGC